MSTPASPVLPAAMNTSPSTTTATAAPMTGTSNRQSPPPYQALASPSARTTSHQSSLPGYDHSASSSSSSSNSRPAARRMSSQSDVNASSSRSSISTAPTTPNLGGGNGGHFTRSWRPTPNVPPTISNRHRAIDSGEEERNRWLSEDEGLDGVARSIGRRRRRQSSDGGGGRHGGSGGNGDGGGSGTTPASGPARRSGSTDRQAHSTGDPGPSTLSRLEDKINLAVAPKSRPHPRRARSFEAARQESAQATAIRAADVTNAQSSGIGANPPRIQDIVPAPTSPVQAFAVNVASDQETPIDKSGITPMETSLGKVPDFASGRGGDGIGGVGLPVGGNADDIEDATARQDDQVKLLEKLRNVLGCALCPSDRGNKPCLHHPITLPCGHTLSAEHIAIPAPPPLQITSNQPHEIAFAQQRQHQQRLNLWAGVMCPIPTCKRYSATASASPVVDLPTLSTGSPTLPVRSGAQRGEMLASGVTYYPPALPTAPPAYSADPPATVAPTAPTPMLDVTVDKILGLVLREKERRENELFAIRAPTGTETDESDDEEDSAPGPSYRSLRTGLSRDLSQLGQSANPPTSPLARQSSKRRRNNHTTPARARSSGSPYDWPFKKELAGVLECDVCAMMLYEPVTTPCQHSFCSRCLSRSLDHSQRCPLCRQELPSFAYFQDHAVNRVLLTIIKTAFPEEYTDRSAAIEREERDARLDTPIFVCTLAFPGMPTILHVFEPRYRLMIRRCIESSSPRFGMVLPARGTGAAGLQGVMEYGTMLEIQSVQMLPDGRSMVETVGTHRFKLLEKGNLDGYTVGRIERIDDISAEEEAQLQEAAVRAAVLHNSTPGPVSSGQGSTHTIISSAPSTASSSIPPTPQVAEEQYLTTEEYMNICRSFIEQLRSGSAPWLLQRLNNTYGTMPTDPSEFSYWMALVIPIDEYEKARLLPIRSPRLRLKLIVHWVESLRSSWWFSSG